MKRTVFPLALLLLTAQACQKTNLPAAPSAPGKQTTHVSARETVDFNYMLVKDANGNYSCPTPKNDCAKVEPNPTGILQYIDAAIANGTVQDFFNSDDWQDEFPYLDDQSTVVLKLQSGDYTMIRKTNPAGDIFYIVVSSSVDPDKFNVSDGVYTTMVKHK